MLRMACPLLHTASGRFARCLVLGPLVLGPGARVRDKDARARAPPSLWSLARAYPWVWHAPWPAWPWRSPLPQVRNIGRAIGMQVAQPPPYSLLSLLAMPLGMARVMARPAMARPLGLPPLASWS